MTAQAINYWDKQTATMTRRTPIELYMLTVEYTGSKRVDEYVCRNRGECLLIAEVCRRHDAGETGYTITGSKSITLWTHESGKTTCYNKEDFA
jgi:hypothetical protein